MFLVGADFFLLESEISQRRSQRCFGSAENAMESAGPLDPNSNKSGMVIYYILEKEGRNKKIQSRRRRKMYQKEHCHYK